MARRKTGGRSSKAAAGRTLTGEIAAWEDDPGAPDEPRTPITRPVPDLARSPLPTRIAGRAPAPKSYTVGTAGFRYWTAAEALRRASDYWGGLVPQAKWFTTVGAQLQVTLDVKEDFNADYNRAGLRFYHGPVDGVLVYSGESPDVVAHEFGHALLDAIRPQLWDAASDEVAAFHESFGDMSAMLVALQLDSFREQVLRSTAGSLARSSQLSRLAEQLGWGIRTAVRPDAVDRDCLRNAANSLFYQDPTTLPPSAPASALSSESHSFSRVFSAAFLQALAGVFQAQPRQNSNGLLTASQDIGALLAAAVQAAPVVPSYYSQVAAHMIEADATDFGGRYNDALKSGFVRQGVLALDAAGGLGASMVQRSTKRARRSMVGMVGTVGAPVYEPRRAKDDALPRVAVAGAAFGLERPLVVHAAAEPKRFAVAGAAAGLRSFDPPTHDRAATAFAASLFRRGRVDLADVSDAELAPARPAAHKTHTLEEGDEGLVLRRLHFDCGLGGCADYH
ncbi:MAG TPA: hypothetical protein VJT75_01140 [Thermoleophilaceae bacterium]|nr:hypothetical protein [Thermoleophilaceae bacterium]